MARLFICTAAPLFFPSGVPRSCLLLSLLKPMSPCRSKAGGLLLFAGLFCVVSPLASFDLLAYFESAECGASSTAGASSRFRSMLTVLMFKLLCG